MNFRRLRKNAAIRSLVAETEISAADIIAPYFVREGRGVARAIDSMPGVSQFSADRVVEDMAPMVAKGLKSVLLFGVPNEKDPGGRSSIGPLVPDAIQKIRSAYPNMVIMTDVCLCGYTSHGQCAPLDARGKIDEPAALERYAEMAVVHARAGADVVAPSGMMDGAVEAIRKALDGSGNLETAIMGYSAKYASHFYGPFRDAAESAPKHGDRTSYQMDPPNRLEALREIEQDIAEGADIVMIKPALSYLDIIRDARENFTHPIAAYSVSGEYSMIEGAIERGWMSENVRWELLRSIKRAGADLIITYHAKHFFDQLPAAR